MSDPVLRVIRLREALAIAERERDEARADRLERMVENERLRQSGGALCVERAMLEQECDHLRKALATADRRVQEEHTIARHIWKTKADAAEALLREAAEVIEKLNDHPRYWDGFYEKASSLLARIKEATNG